MYILNLFVAFKFFYLKKHFILLKFNLFLKSNFFLQKKYFLRLSDRYNCKFWWDDNLIFQNRALTKKRFFIGT
jgi:hypothetical protein